MKIKLIIGLIIMIIFVFLIGKDWIEKEMKQSFERKIPIGTGDLLKIYAEKPKHLRFKKLVIGKGQISYDALYEVEGKHSKEVEDFLVEKYGMGKLKWVCCGYENTNGERGQLTINLDEENNFDFMIGMYAIGETMEESDEMVLEFEREKLIFTVSVKLIFHKNF